MAQFLTTRNIESAIEDLIKEARNALVFISPFLQTHPILLERLGDAARRGVPITVVCRKEDLKHSQRKELLAIPTLTLRFMEHLHAKCYINETRVILSSMNLYEASRKNREMGIMLDHTSGAYRDALAEVDSIIANSLIYEEEKPRETRPVSSQNLPKPAPPRAKKVKTSKPSDGHCIRCVGKISHKLEKPLCKSCHESWAKFSNKEYPESYCHSCGQKKDGVSFLKPQCYGCWKKHQKKVPTQNSRRARSGKPGFQSE